MNNFAVPGLMPMTAPKFDNATMLLSLYPHQQHTTMWVGIDAIGPILFEDQEGVFTSPPADAARMVLEFWPKMYPERECVVFDSEAGADGLTTIVSPESWLFAVHPQPLPLVAGWWDWRIYVVDVEDHRTDLYDGQIQILP